MNLKNHTTFRPWMLTGDRGDSPEYAPSTTYKWNLKDIPAVTRRMANYLVGLLVTLEGAIFMHEDAEGGPFGGEAICAADVLYGLFESAEVQQTMFGTPVSSNHYLSRYFGLFEFVGNGMQPPAYAGNDIPASTASSLSSYSFFVPLSALCGMKGHHTAQLACCYDRAQFVLRTRGAGAIPGIQWLSGGTMQVSAIVVPEPEVRLGPPTQFVLYRQTAAPTGTVVTLDALGNASTLEGVEQGAGIAMALWMTNKHGYGGAGRADDMEYLSVPWRDLQQTRHMEPFFVDWWNACKASAPGFTNNNQERVGHLYGAGYPQGGGSKLLGAGAHFLPIVAPHPFLETSKLQVVQGSATVNLKNTSGFSGEHVIAVQQYHSPTPAKIEDVLRKVIDSGVMQAVWGTNDVIPSTKVIGKQPVGGLNLSKTRFFATTWVPKTVVPAPPSQ